MAITRGGARLAYTVVPLEGTLEREVCEFTSKGIVRKKVKQPAGFMVYFPRGHAIRLKDEADLAKYGLDRKPPVINLQGLSNPNSPLGQMLMEQDENARHGAMESMKMQVINLATAKSGPVLMPEQLRRVRSVREAAVIEE